MGNSYNGLRRLWRPGGEQLDVIAGVLTERWRAAAQLSPSRLFWQVPGRWLKPELRPQAGERPHHFTTGGRLIR